MPRRTLLGAPALALGGALAGTGPSRAQGSSQGSAKGSGQAPTRLRMVLNWKYQGPQGWFFLAEDRGYFREAGLAMTIDQGEGSSAPVTQIAAGAYDVGFGDMNALIQFAATRPDVAPLAVFMMYNVPPFCIAVRADSPIRTPQDLVGRTIGGPANDGELKLFPAFAKAAGIDAAKVNIVTMQPSLREQMLFRGQIDGAFGYVNTIRFSARGAGIDDRQLRYIRYADHGIDLYSNTIMVSRALARDKPEAVRGLLAAINRGVAEALKDPAAAVAAVGRRDSLLDLAVERARFDATVADEMSAPELARIGLGDIDEARMARAIATVAESNNLPTRPAVGDVFSRAFLPPLAERPRKLVD
ncbi:ABC transporter substrate-binding protein [Roseomonas sp. NAR14]|uniref:Thiamine pyrimidine synthase n=2 Tax=Roseomonas acroporae TaxID=2937791 RepID=A0A9X1YA11_9PROT|nr:ABC transporter substrate-binding protein [Roseomonas acroporae]